jgi:hypothetical protein
MRSKMIIVVTAVVSLLLTPLMASADQVQEQLRLMGQRMAEMEDRLQATSVELETAKATVDQQQGLLSEAGLIDADDSGLRSGVGGFLSMVDISGVIAASYNHRLDDAENSGNLAGGNSLFRHPNADTFALDQFWLVMDKSVSEDSRAGFHVEYVTGQAGLAQGGNGDDEAYLYSAYVSYLTPRGTEINMGRLATPLGAEVVQANGNWNITQGNVFSLQPVTHTGVSFARSVSDSLDLTVGIVNGVYSDTAVSTTNDKAYYAQLAYAGDGYGLNVGVITGDDTDSCAGGADCSTTVVDVVFTTDLSDRLSVWANFDWVNTKGSDTASGEAIGIAAAGRMACTDSTGLAVRIEYVDSDLSGADSELFSLTSTVDHSLTDSLTVRGELRWDRQLEDGGVQFAGGSDDQAVALAELLFAF